MSDLFLRSILVATDSVVDVKVKAYLERLQSTIQQALGNDDGRLAARYEALSLLGEVMNSPVRSHADKILFSLVDRVPTFAEGAQCPEDFKNYLSFLDAFLSSSNHELRQNIDKMIPKLTALASRLASKPGKEEFAMNILLIVLQSGHRTFASQQCFTIRESLAKLVLYADERLSLQAASVVALTHSLDSGELWVSHLLVYSNELVNCCKSLGMPVAGIPTDYSALLAAYNNNSNNNNNTKTNTFLEKKRSSVIRGLDKAVAVLGEFRGFCGIVSKMFHVGCSGGMAAPDLTILLPLATNLLSTYIRISQHDPKIYVENDQNVSLLDIASVSSEMKFHFLGVLHSLLSTRHNALITVANRLLRPLAIVLSSDEMKQVSTLAARALDCFQLSIQLFPTVISKNTNFGAEALVQLYQSAAEHLVRSDSSVLIESEASKLVGYSQNIDFRVTAAEYSMIFATIETLLLHCGPHLPSNLRNSIEVCNGKLLQVMNKGVGRAHFDDRRMRLHSKELIRTDFDLQNALLTLSLAEVLSSGNQSNGVYSSNISLLRQSAVIASKLVETSRIAMRVLQALDVAIHPTAITLTSLPAHLIAEQAIKAAEDAAVAAANKSLTVESVSEQGGNVTFSHVEYKSNPLDKNTSASSIFDSEVTISADKKRTSTIFSESIATKKFKEADATSVVVENKTFSFSSTVKNAAESVVPSTLASLLPSKAAADDEDDELPDLE